MESEREVIRYRRLRVGENTPDCARVLARVPAIATLTITPSKLNEPDLVEAAKLTRYRITNLSENSSRRASESFPLIGRYKVVSRTRQGKIDLVEIDIPNGSIAGWSPRARRQASSRSIPITS